MIRGRLHRRHKEGHPAQTEDEFVEIEAGELTGLFATPSWLRDLGLTSWLVVGVTLLLVGAIWLLSLTHTIVVPVIVAAVIASVASPLLGRLGRHGLPRGLGAGLLLLVMGPTLYQATYSNINERGPDEDQEYQCVHLGDAQLGVKLDSTGPNIEGT